jgi:hypothetical protein
MMARTPDSISAKVLDLCRQINSAGAPMYITITPEPGCAPNDCFECIRQKVAREGGRVQFGWTIWEWPHVYLEAEHHAVYEPRTGPPWVDITPSVMPEIRRRLFLPDDGAVYDFETEGVLRDNKRLALNDDPLIQEFFAAATRKTEILNSIPGVNVTVNDVDAATLERISEAERELGELTVKLAMKYTPQNAPCPCGSGQKFKRCHGQPRKGFRP